MQTSRRTRIALALAAALTVVAGVAVVVFAGHHSAPTSTRGGDAEYGTLGPHPEGTDPATAAKMALTAMFTWFPATDASAGVGLTRAGQQGWLTGQLAAEATAPPATGMRPMREWADWAAAKDVVTATVTVTGGSPPTGGDTLITAEVRQEVLHTDNSKTPWRVLTVAASLSNTATGWRLANYRVTG